MSGYPEGAVVHVADMGPVERAWAEAEHEDCTDSPADHPLSAHEPWSGGDLDGVEPWPSFEARLARHGLTLSFGDADAPVGGLRAEIAAMPTSATVWTGEPLVRHADVLAIVDRLAAATSSADAGAGGLAGEPVDELALHHRVCHFDHATCSFDHEPWPCSAFLAGAKR